MMNKIRTFEDLIARQQQLEVLLKLQKEQLRYDIRDLMDAGKSVVIGGVGNSLLQKTVNKSIDLVVKQGVLGQAGWLYRMIIPFLMKKYSKSYISDHRKEIKDKFLSLFRSKSNGVKKESTHN